MLAKASVKAAVAKAQAKVFEKLEVKAEKVIEEAGRIAFANVRDAFDGANLRNIHELTEAQSAAIASVEVIIKNAKAGDNQTDTIYKVRYWDKPKALEMLGKHFALWTERIEHSGEVTYRWAE